MHIRSQLEREGESYEELSFRAKVFGNAKAWLKYQVAHILYDHMMIVFGLDYTP